MLTLENIKNYGEYIVLESKEPLRTFSSAMHNPGYGEYQVFMNRTVDLSYNPLDAHEEMQQFIQQCGYPLPQTVAMMTAVDMKFAFTGFYEDGDTSIVILVTTGLGNAVDITRSYEYAHPPRVGTINTFIFINGYLTDEALIQALCGAVEVKTKILAEHQILDPQSGTIATGTSTDSICIASTQTGEAHAYGGSITKLGKLIGKGLYDTMNCSVESFLEYKKGNR
ncbi:adenosylcobinamide amidohydrolase [Ureibacillus xyleni]|uniref:Adenosylcobinamide amidohydrolase n=1 Tax=Ureibacillus xyleni TaxID=614648 RepID=A0A285RIW8_9BACL|nr:adenosylcobinamide amidohydrolase [Ureibacillus xyleni]SOB93824.1 adenosylcobinamide amidohydrolase [Ureibacillus xyleni]